MGVKTDAEIVAGGVVLVVLAFFYFKDSVGEVLAHPVKAVGDYAATQVEDVGEMIGIPRTNMTACEKAIAEGRTLDASFACPAGTFLGSLF